MKNSGKTKPRLTTALGIRRELCALYVEARAGQIDPITANRLANILELARRALELSEIERRMSELEQS